jgi:hypothetical protein
VENEMRDAAGRLQFERAAGLRRRLGRLRTLLRRLGGVLEATHARPRLVLVPHPRAPCLDAFWLVGGRLVDWGPVPGGDELARRTARALGHAERGTGTFLPSEEIDEVRIVSTWLAGRDDLPSLDLASAPDSAALEAFVAGALAPAVAA